MTSIRIRLTATIGLIWAAVWVFMFYALNGLRGQTLAATPSYGAVIIAWVIFWAVIGMVYLGRELLPPSFPDYSPATFWTLIPASWATAIATAVAVAETKDGSYGLLVIAFVAVGAVVVLLMDNLYGLASDWRELFFTSAFAILFITIFYRLVNPPPVIIEVVRFNQPLWIFMAAWTVAEVAWTAVTCKQRGFGRWWMTRLLLWQSLQTVWTFQLLWLAVTEIVLGRLWPILPTPENLGDFVYRGILFRILGEGLPWASVVLIVFLVVAAAHRQSRKGPAFSSN